MILLEVVRPLDTCKTISLISTISSAKYGNYTEHYGNCFNTSLLTSKSTNISQTECGLLCDELAQCKGFLSTTEGNCELKYDKCITNKDEFDQHGTNSFEKQKNMGNNELST